MTTVILLVGLGACTAGGGGGGGGGGDGTGVGEVCDGCAGYPCETNGDCADGMNCRRINPGTAWCTNCTSESCAHPCAADFQCGEGGACVGEACFHACESEGDCPVGYECFDQAACIPQDLPDLDEECATSAAFFCRPDPGEARICLYDGPDPVADPGDSFCSRACDSDADCQDVWTLGCCVELSGGEKFCVRRDYC